MCGRVCVPFFHCKGNLVQSYYTTHREFWDAWPPPFKILGLSVKLQILYLFLRAKLRFSGIGYTRIDIWAALSVGLCNTFKGTKNERTSHFMNGTF